jgi:hypothetical protein
MRIVPDAAADFLSAGAPLSNEGTSAAAPATHPAVFRKSRRDKSLDELMLAVPLINVNLERIESRRTGGQHQNRII